MTNPRKNLLPGQFTFEEAIVMVFETANENYQRETEERWPTSGQDRVGKNHPQKHGEGADR